MINRQARVDTGIGVSCIVSTVIHLAVFLLLLWKGFQAPLAVPPQETYYVDVVNLPVADPRSGSPLQKGNAEQPAAPLPVEQPAPMKLPAKTAPQQKPAAKAQPEAPDKSSASSEAAFAERMARLEKNAEARHEEAVLEKLRGKVKSSGSGRAGMPAAAGKESGSDYSAYIQSRLKDAFRETISFSSKNPEIIVRLFIDVDGHLNRRVTERSSGDRAFELAVIRAIEMASEKFTAPPGRKTFEGVFVFKPQGITPSRPK